MDRIAFLEDFLLKKPDDTFARYALATEYANQDRVEDALAAYQTLLQRDPDYHAAWHQAALLLKKQKRYPEAKDMLRKGIDAASRARKAHERQKMEAALEDLEALAP